MFPAILFLPLVACLLAFAALWATDPFAAEAR